MPRWILPAASCEFLAEIARILPPGSTAFEFGSGRSTHLLRHNLSGVTSIEDSRDWLEKTEALPDHRPLMRRLITGAAAVTLIACFAWAIGHRKHPPAVSQIPVPTWPAPAAIVAAPRASPPAAPPVAVATDPVNAASFVEVPTAKADQVLRALKSSRIRGQDPQPTIARPAGPEAERRPAAPKRRRQSNGR